MSPPSSKVPSAGQCERPFNYVCLHTGQILAMALGKGFFHLAGEEDLWSLCVWSKYIQQLQINVGSWKTYLQGKHLLPDFKLDSGGLRLKQVFWWTLRHMRRTIDVDMMSCWLSPANISHNIQKDYSQKYLIYEYSQLKT